MEEIIKRLEEIIKRSMKIEGLLTELSQEQNPEFITINEAAQLLRVTRPTLWAWDRKGILPVQRIGNVGRYRKSDIDDLLNQKKPKRQIA